MYCVQENNELECLLRLMLLGLKSLRLIDTKEYYEDKFVSLPPSQCYIYSCYIVLFLCAVF